VLQVAATVAYPDEGGRTAQAAWTLPLVCRAAADAFKLTFVDYDGAVHYTMVRRPRLTCPPEGCMTVTTLHGAGVEASSGAWTSAYDQRDTAWVRAPPTKYGSHGVVG